MVTEFPGAVEEPPGCTSDGPGVVSGRLSVGMSVGVAHRVQTVEVEVRVTVETVV